MTRGAATEAIRAVWDRHTAGGAFSGACLFQDGEGDLFAGCCGLANRDFAVPVAMDTAFDTASVTKLFTAVAVLQLAQRGLLGLQDPIHRLVNLAGTAIDPAVTVHQLLSHTSGIADDADEEAGEDYAALFADKPNYAIRNNADFLPNFAYKPANFPPGTNVRYNNCAFVLLGLAVEALTGQNYREYVAQNIFAPAGMARSAFCARDEVNPGAAEGYFGVYGEDGALLRWRKNIYSYPPVGTADGGAYSTVGDLARFFRAVQGGGLLNAAHTALLLAPQVPFTRPYPPGIRRYGYAFEFQQMDGETHRIFKEGSNTGVDAMLAYYPRLDATLTMLSNQDGPFWTMFGEMNRALI